MEDGKLHDYTTDNMTMCYRGFIENDDFVYAVYDMTNFMKLPIRPTKRAEWCILHELMDLGLTNNSVVDFFEKYPYMSVVNSDTIVRYPICLYLYDIVKREHMIRDKSMALLEPRSYHPLFGNFFYFVQDCPPDNKPYRKCAVFMENIIELNIVRMNRQRSARLYSEQHEDSDDIVIENSMDDKDDYIEDDPVADSYLEELENVDHEDVDEDMSESPEEPNEEQNEESNEEPNEESPEEPNEEPNEESNEESNKESNEESNKESLNEGSLTDSYPFTSIIAFNDNNVNIWCVKTQSLFTEL
jgi:hypothetical protein